MLRLLLLLRMLLTESRCAWAHRRECEAEEVVRRLRLHCWRRGLTVQVQLWLCVLNAAPVLELSHGLVLDGTPLAAAALN